MQTINDAIPANILSSRIGREMLVILALGAVVYMGATRYDVLEYIVAFSNQHESWELDELITLSIYFFIALTLFSWRRWHEVRISKRALSQSYKDLQRILVELKQLRGILPICASCKKIRDDGGYWHQVEVYIRDHTEAEFSHSLCPDCMRKLYPDLIKDGS